MRITPTILAGADVVIDRGDQARSGLTLLFSPSGCPNVALKR